MNALQRINVCNLLLVLLVLLPWASQQERLHQSCYESVLLDVLNYCYEIFNQQIHEIDKERWCNLNAVGSIYAELSNCTQAASEYCRWYWPNQVVQELFLYIHAEYFINCTTESTEIVDETPATALVAMVLLPICLIPVMLTPLLWCNNSC